MHMTLCVIYSLTMDLLLSTNLILPSQVISAYKMSSIMNQIPKTVRSLFVIHWWTEQCLRLLLWVQDICRLLNSFTGRGMNYVQHLDNKSPELSESVQGSCGDLHRLFPLHMNMSEGRFMTDLPVCMCVCYALSSMWYFSSLVTFVYFICKICNLVQKSFSHILVLFNIVSFLAGQEIAK